LKFFHRKSPLSGPNEAWRIGFRALALRLAALAVSAFFMAAALPPLNWSGGIWLAMVPALIVLYTGRVWSGGFFAWLWATLYGLFGYWWLREIHPAVPWLIAPVYGLYYLPFGWLLPGFYRYWLVPVKTRLAGYDACRAAPPPGWWREICLVLSTAALYILLEYLRWDILPWNNLSATQWRTRGLIGLAAWTGPYGIGFLIVLVNSALAITALGVFRCRRGYRRAWALLFAIMLLGAVLLLNLAMFSRPAPAVTSGFTVGVIQPNPAQRHIGMSAEVRAAQDEEALEENLRLSRQVLAAAPQLLIWPETSIGVPFRADSGFGRSYRRRVAQLLAEFKAPLLLGTIDWEELPADVTRRPGLTNSVFLLDSNSDGSLGVVERYDKQHLVPFGEYVPFRRWLPQWAIDRISMGDDLRPGARMDPIRLPLGVKAGVNICFEDIFPYIAREQVRRGAELLLVSTNDSWYPNSAEQQQHLANSVFRAVETGVPMIRCGSNSGSVMIHPDGAIQPLAGIDPFRPTRGGGTFAVQLPAEWKPTFFVRFGDWWIGVCLAVTAISLIFVAGRYGAQQRALRRRALNQLSETGEDSHE